MLRRKKSLEDELYLLGGLFLAVGIIGIIFYFKIILPTFPVIPCMFNKVFGLYCPGCGGTRAFIALFQGELLLSMWYHPLVLYTAIIFGGFMLTQTLERLHIPKVKGWKFHAWHLYGAVVIILLNFMIKNILLRCFQITL